MSTKIDVMKMKVYPPADVFPMLAEDDLEELAADIAEFGLRDPLVIAEIDEEWMLIDGRNRRAACKKVGIEPTVQKLGDVDPTAYVLSANIHRRHLTKSQRAMVVAMIYPEPEKGGRGRQRSISNLGFDPKYLSQARAVVPYPDLSKGVLDGSVSLHDAKVEADEREDDVRKDSRELRKLKASAPDLAEAVESGVLQLDHAQTQLHEREAEAARKEKERSEQRWALTMNLIESVRALDRDPTQASEVAEAYDPDVAKSKNELITPKRLRDAAAFLSALAQAMETSNGD